MIIVDETDMGLCQVAIDKIYPPPRPNPYLESDQLYKKDSVGSMVMPGPTATVDSPFAIRKDYRTALMGS